jgi:hypothetical protein
MGIGPTAAIPKLLSKFQLDKNDIDIYEGNSTATRVDLGVIKTKVLNTVDRHRGESLVDLVDSATVAGVPPRVMGIGPTAAIPKLLSKFQLDKNDIDIYEINEAFASMAVYCVLVKLELAQQLRNSSSWADTHHARGHTGNGSATEPLWRSTVLRTLVLITPRSTLVAVLLPLVTRSAQQIS